VAQANANAAAAARMDVLVFLETKARTMMQPDVATINDESRLFADVESRTFTA
jgi:hypothetical protein